jgi:hypothetical protein
MPITPAVIILSSFMEENLLVTLHTHSTHEPLRWFGAVSSKIDIKSSATWEPQAVKK